MAKKPISQVRQRELARLRKFMRRAEKRGFRFVGISKDTLSELSTQKLKSLTPEKLYSEYSFAISEETGKTITGSERRAEERREAAIKATETRVKGKFAETEEGKNLAQQLLDEAQNIIEDEKDAFTQITTNNIIYEGRVIYSNIEYLIDTHKSMGSVWLRTALNQEINAYGFDRVVASFALAPSGVIEAAQTIVFYPDEGSTASEAHRAFIRLGDIIKGTAMSEQDARTIGDILDSMGYGKE